MLLTEACSAPSPSLIPFVNLFGTYLEMFSKAGADPGPQGVAYLDPLREEILTKRNWQIASLAVSVLFFCHLSMHRQVKYLFEFFLNCVSLISLILV